MSFVIGSSTFNRAQSNAVTLVPLLSAFLVATAELVAEATLADSPSALDPGRFFRRASVHALGAMCVWLVGQLALLASHRLPGKQTVRVPATVVLGATAPTILFLGELTSGSWIAEQPFVTALRWGGAALILLAVALVAWLCVRLSDSPTLPLGLLAVSVASTLANSAVLPDLYPSAHLFLYVVTLVSAVSGVTFAVRRVPVDLRWWGRWGLAALVAGALLTASWGLSKRRGALVAASPGLGAALSLLLPPLDGHHLRRELLAQRWRDKRPPQQPRKGVFPPKRPRSVLLVVVDTLRGDALPPVRDGDESFADVDDTPQLNGWLKRSFRFDSAYSSSSRTKASMPPMFRSLQPFEDPEVLGEPLSDFARDLGLRPVAVVPQYFLLPAQERSQALLFGFEQVEIYEKDHQEEMLPRAKRLFERLGDEPFLAWVHFYNMHSPYFAGEQLRKGKLTKNYQKALRWLDEQFGQLLQLLEARGLAESTMVILASDHGEHLGEGKKQGHGGGVTQEEIHVPLAISVPGLEGHRISHLVGNIDVVPTVLGAWGHPPRSSHRGRSLFPLLMDAGKWDDERALYVTAGNDSRHALLTQRHKLVFATKLGVFSLFDREVDPHDRQDLFGVDPSLDRQLVSRFVRQNPGLFLDELEDASTLELAQKFLDEATANSPPGQLRFVLKIAAQSQEPKLVRAAQRLFARTEDLQTRLLVSSVFAPVAPKLFGRKWQPVLLETVGTPRERFLVDRLADDGIVLPDAAIGAARITELADGRNSAALSSWLELVEPWKKRRAKYLPAFERVLQSRDDPATSTPEMQRIVTSCLANIATLSRARGRSAKRIEAIALRYARSTDVVVAKAAVKALGVVGGGAARRGLRRLIRGDFDARVRQAAMYSLAAIDGKRGLRPILRAGKDPLLTADAIRIAGRMRRPAALEFLRGIVENHYNAWTRGQARDAIAQIEKNPR